MWCPLLYGEIERKMKGPNLKKSLTVLILMAGFIAGFAADSRVEKMYGQGAQIVPGTVIVKFAERTGNVESNGAVLRLLQSYGVTDFERVFKSVRYKSDAKRKITDLSRIYKLTVPSGVDVLDMVQELNANPNVVYAEPDIVMPVERYIPNDSLYQFQEHLPQIFGPEAWEISKGSEKAIFATLDTGVDWKHPDLAPNIWQNLAEDADGDGHTLEFIDGEWQLDPGDLNGIDDDDYDNDPSTYIDDLIGWDYIDGVSDAAANEDADDPDNDPMDVDSHGTHVSGCAIPTTDNNLGVAGIAFHGRIMALRCGWATSDGNGLLSFAALGNALVYAADHGAHVANISTGSSNSVRDAARYAFENGVLTSKSAGNSNNEVSDPLEREPFALVVSALDDRNLKATYSSFGDWVTVSAPGGDQSGGRPGILSTVPGGRYARYQGTSMSAPVAGGLALLLAGYSIENNLGWGPSDILMRIVETADPIYDLNPGYAGKLGSGAINALRALSEDVTPQPKIQLLNFVINDSLTGNNDKLLDIGETVDIVVTLKNTWGDASNVTVSLSIDDPEVEVLSNSANIGLFPGLSDLANSTKQNLTQPFQIRVSDSSVPHRIKTIVTVTSDQGTWEFQRNIAIDPRILVVDDDVPGKDGFSKDVEDFYYQALDAIDVSFDTWDIDFLGEEPKSKVLMPYDIVIWGTEVTSPTLNTANRAGLKIFFEQNGGKAILFGQDIGWDLADVTSDTNEYHRDERSLGWYETYLGARYLEDDGDYNRVLGVDGDPVTDGLDFYFEQPFRAFNLQNPDIIDTLDGSRALLTSPTGQVAAVAHHGRSNGGKNYASLYYAFGGLEAITDETVRLQLLANSINYLNGLKVKHLPVRDLTVPSQQKIVANITMDSDTLTLERVEMLYTINSVYPATVVAMQEDSAGMYSAVIPEIPEGEVEYQILVKASNGYYAPRIHYSYTVGADVKPPRITIHQPLYNSLNKSGPLEVIAKVEDNLAVNPESVYIHFWTNRSAADSAMAQQLDDQDAYGATITGDFLYGDTLMYYLSAADMASQPNMARTATDTVVLGLEDFEHGLWAWEADSNGTWGLQTEEPFDGLLSLTDSPGATPKPDNETVLLYRTPLDLSATNYAVLTYAARYMLRPGKDVVNIELSSDDGQNWTSVARMANLNPNWKEFFVPIPEFSGPGFDRVWLRLRMTTKTGEVAEKFYGMQLDNLYIHEDIAESVSAGSEAVELPTRFALEQNYPNPFNPTTTIQYQVPASAQVKLEIFNMLGQRIRTLIDQNRQAGSYQVVWDGKDDFGRNVATGMYVYRMQAADFTSVRKLILLK